ncbi:GDP-L-fucose synthase [bacterium]|nr:GDP-L-fucose synthase [bacterium]
MDKNSKIYLAGHRGLVGSAILRRLQKEGFNNIVFRTHKELDLCDKSAVEEFFEKEKPEYVILAAAKVGGIMANSTYPAEFIYQNLMIGLNIVEASRKHNVKKLVNLGSSCIYPRMAPQPMKEDCLLTSTLEKTNEAYALAKISIIKLCKYYNEQYGTNYISLMPTNQYGIGDNFNMETAHLLPMILRRFHLAKLLSLGDFDAIKRDLKRYKLGWGLDEKLNDNNIEEILNEIGAYRNKVVLWGDGSVYREMMSSDDLADAVVYLMMNKDYKDIGELVNITKGDDIQLKDLFEIVKSIVGFSGEIVYDKTKPNGTPRKMMDATKIKALGWEPKIDLKEGIKDFYDWYLNQK